MFKFYARVFLVLLAIQVSLSATLTQPLFAQGIVTGSLSGTVTDSSGAVIPGAMLSVVDDAKGTTFKTTSSQSGAFTFQSLPIGTYKLTVTAASFQSSLIKNVGVTSGNDSVLGKVVLGVTSSEAISVEASSTIALDTTSSQVSAVFDSQALASLPLNNGFDEVALLTPGVVPTHDVAFSNSNGASFSSNGLRGRSNNFELDGQSNNDNSVAGPQIFFGNEDAIAEIQVVQSNFSAQYGRNTGSIVNYITKGGTNAIHGSAFELYEGSFLSSYPNQDKSPILGYCAPGQDPATTGCNPVSRLPRSVDNRYGGTLGFSILKDKLWGFASTYYEHTRNGASPFNSGASLTPTPTGLTMLAATFPGNPAVAVLQNYGPYGIKDGNPQPIGAVSSETVTAPDGSSVSIPVSAVLRTAASGNYTDQEQLGRIDYQATPKDRFFIRYFYQKSLGSNYADNGAAGIFYDVPDVNHSVGADWTRTISSRWVNQLRYSFQQSKLDFQAGSLPDCTVNTLTACPGNVNFENGLGLTHELGFGQATNLPQGRTVKVTQVQDNVSVTFGKQTLLLGGEFDYQNSPNVFLPNYNGSFLPFNGLDDFVHQNGDYLLSSGNPVLPFKEKDYALYVQDDYKVSSELTVNLGLRWEFFGQAVNTLNDITTKRESNPATALWDPSLPLSARTTPRVNNAWKNYEPRIGFAYNPGFDKKLVIRGAYSIGFDPAFYNLFLNFATSAPSAITKNIGCGGTCLGTGDFTGAGNRAANLARLPTGGNPGSYDQEFVAKNFHNPYAQTFSLGLERSITPKLLGSLRYVGNHGVGNFQSRDANPYLLPVQQAFPSYAPGTLCTDLSQPGFGRPNCALGNESFVSNSAFSIYNSLQASLTMKAFYGFSGSVNYTFSHTIDNSSEVYSSGAGGSTIAVSQNPLDTDNAERGNAATDLPNALSVGMVYTLPTLHTGKSLVRTVVNGFQVNAIYQYSSGQPYNPYQSFAGSYCDTSFNSSSVGPGADSCRLAIANPKAPLQSVAIALQDEGGAYEFFDYGTGEVVGPTTDHWVINNAAYANFVGNPYPGSGRNILRAQNFDNLDMSVFKDTKIRERLNLELQFDAYNALNRQFRGTPLAFVGYDLGFSGQANPFLSNGYNNSNQRVIQLGAKIKF